MTKSIGALEQSIIELEAEISLLSGSIKCDVNEQATHPNIIHALGDYAEIRQLISGDYAFRTKFDRLARIEYKVISDLINSMSTGRMSEQIAKVPKGDIGILLIEGWWTVDHNGYLRTKSKSWKRPYSWLWNYLLSAQLSGIYIYLSPNEFMTPRLIISIFDWFNKNQHDALSQRPKLHIMYPSLTPKQIAFSSLPAVGEELSKRLCAHFNNSLLALCNAEVEEIAKVEGVGKRKAEFIYKFVRDLI